MSFGIRAFVAFSILLTVQLGPAPPARAQVSVARLAGLQGRIVVLERYDGSWLLVRILAVGPTHVTVELEDGLRGSIAHSAIAKARLRRPDEAPPVQERAATSKEKRPTATKPHKFRVEWIGARMGLGIMVEQYRGGFREYFAGFAELTLFTLHWRHFYWEILRVGGGMPFVWHWGTAIGYPFHLDDAERHELRLGVHLSFGYGMNPTLSGVQCYYLYRPSKRFGFHVGIMQTSYPFSVNAVIGISM